MSTTVERVALHLIRAEDHLAKAWMAVEWAYKTCPLDHEDKYAFDYLQDEISRIEDLNKKVAKVFIEEAGL